MQGRQESAGGVKALRHAAAMALLLAAAAAHGKDEPAPSDPAQAAVTDAMRQHWGALADLAGKSYVVESSPGVPVWRDVRWIVPGESLRYANGWCRRSQCDNTEFVVRFNAASKQLEYTHGGAIAATGTVNPDGSVTARMAGLFGNSETIDIDRASGSLKSGGYLLQPITRERLVELSRGLAGKEVVATPARNVAATPSAGTAAAPASGARPPVAAAPGDPNALRFIVGMPMGAVQGAPYCQSGIVSAQPPRRWRLNREGGTGYTYSTEARGAARLIVEAHYQAFIERCRAALGAAAARMGEPGLPSLLWWNANEDAEPPGNLLAGSRPGTFVVELTGR
ncbi:hypothetical protein PE066_01305 [Ramlibacter tataouinensis]|uniref:hypothetical protein n=1 Tax=Ramlibacter tataouinensis TaxID=94132 RepID=UPI0022F39AF2|nr:hypothetical protein [Ramlibacter tataouinensis]WBY02198.1 hypothetical protein PE066_01305 [Ramlibacter tataouinensis]